MMLKKRIPLNHIVTDQEKFIEGSKHWAFDSIRRFEEEYKYDLKERGLEEDEGYGKVFLGLRTKETREYVNDVFLKFVKNPDFNIFALAGKKGSGKTISLLNFAAEQSDCYIKNPEKEPFPIYIDFDFFNTIRDFELCLNNICFNYFKDSIVSENSLFRLAQNGYLFFIIDDFDKIIAKMFKDCIIAETGIFHSSKVIISAQEKFFENTYPFEPIEEKEYFRKNEIDFFPLFRGINSENTITL